MEEEKGITIGELFRIIFKRVWWVVGVTAAVLIAFVCIIQFWYNPNNRIYTAQFEIRLPGGNVYPNGTELRLEDSVLLENLQIVKDESLFPESERTGRFANVDVVKMVENDDIDFKQKIEKLEDETYSYTNTVEISEKYFKNDKQGGDFVRAVVEFPVNNAIKIVREMTYTRALDDYDIATSYGERSNGEGKIGKLIEQKKYIESIYNTLASLYSGDYIPAGLPDAKKIKDYLLELSLKFDSREQEALYNTVEAKYYILDSETYINNAQMQIDSLKISITETEAVLVKVREERDLLLQQDKGIQTVESFNETISKLVQENANKENKIKRINKTLEEINEYKDGEVKLEKEKFDLRLKSVRDMLETETFKAREVYVAAFNEKARVDYVNNSIMLSGGMNIILAAAIGLVLGFVAVSAVILIIDLPKYKRKKIAEQAVGEEKQLEIDTGSEE